MAGSSTELSIGGERGGLGGGEGLDPRCRIVVVSSSIAVGRAFVDSVIALSDTTDTATADTSSSPPSTPTATKGHKTLDDKDKEPLIIPYTLTNRYYTAEVHFAVYTCMGFGRELGGSTAAAAVDASEDDVDIPVFESALESGGLDVGFKKDFEEGFEEDEKDGGGGGVRLRAPGVVYVWADGEGYKKEVGDIVGGMRRVGYEPEVCLAVRVPGAGDQEDDDVDGIFMGYGFEYVDARETSDAEEEDVPRLPRVIDALSTVMWVSMESKAKSQDKDKGKGKWKAEERDEIMRELMDVVVSQEEIKSEYDFGKEEVVSPVEMDLLSPFGRVGELGRKVSMGFEDEFVPGKYRTLGSVSDFGGSDFGDADAGYVELDEEEEWEDGVEEVDASWDEPTQEEIEETAGQIFGGFKKASDGFDLSEVLHSLESFKGEIARMEDDDERKKMAARVALGLAYALEIE